MYFFFVFWICIYTAVNISKTRERAEELVSIGFGVADAAHIAFAEKSGTPFISCDDRLIKKCLSGKKEWKMISENDMSIILKYAKKYKLKKIILFG